MSLFSSQSEIQEVAFQHAGQRVIAEIEAKRKNAPVPEPLIVPDDPFDWPADDSWKDEPVGKTIGYQTGITKQKSAFKASTHYPEAKKILDSLHPGLYATVEMEITTRAGFKFKQDLWGFADILGIEDGTARTIACNVTTVGQMRAHLLDWANPLNTYGPGKVRVLTYVRRFLQCGGPLYIIGFEQPGGKNTRWKQRIVPVTIALFESEIAKKEARDGKVADRMRRGL